MGKEMSAFLKLMHQVKVLETQFKKSYNYNRLTSNKKQCAFREYIPKVNLELETSLI